jgi:hypothetical protein
LLQNILIIVMCLYFTPIHVPATVACCSRFLRRICSSVSSHRTLNNAGHDVTRNDELKTFVFDRHCPANRSISSVRYNVPVPAYPPGVASALRSPPRRGDYHGTIEISFKTGRVLQKPTKPPGDRFCWFIKNQSVKFELF